MDVKTYTIPKGKQSSGIHMRPHIGCTHIKRSFMFDESSIYAFHNENQLDINKLFGISFGHHQLNSSVRFGWRSLSPYSDHIEILAYMYDRGNRLHEDEKHSMTTIYLNTWYEYEIVISETSYLMFIWDTDKNLVSSREFPHAKLLPFGYFLYPWFGGDELAIRNIDIKMKK